MDTIAKEIMSNEPVTAQDTDSVEKILKTLINNGITGLPVVDDQNHLVGVVSEYDIIRQLREKGKLKPEDFQEKASFTSQKLVSVQEDSSLEEVLEKLMDSKVRRLPVLNKEKQLIGIITRRDIMRLFYYRAKLS